MKKIRNLLFLFLFLAGITALSFFIASLYPDAVPVPAFNTVITRENAEWNPETSQLETTVTKLDFQDQYVAYRIDDIPRLGVIEKVNYVPNRFIQPNTLAKDSVIADLTDPDFHFAPKGSFQIIILNLDPFDPEFRAKADAMHPYKKGDTWHFSLVVPKTLSACNVYQNFQFRAGVGEIENYNFIDYSSDMQDITEKHKSKIESVTVDLPFYSRREAMADPIASSQIVTVHYEASQQKAGLLALPVIGHENDISHIVLQNRTILTVCTVMALISLAVFALLCILKRSMFFFSHLCISLGIFGTALSAYTLTVSSHYPYFWLALAGVSLYFALAASVYTATQSCRRFPLRTVMTVFSGIGAFLMLFPPFMSYDSANILLNIVFCIVIISSVFILVCSVIRATKHNEEELWRIYAPTALALMILLSVFMPKARYTTNDPLFWMVLFSIPIAFVICCHVFYAIEKHNRYLTENLKAEVAVQTKHLSSLIEERENLLRIVSHDLSKPLISINNFLGVLDERVEEKEEKELVSIIRSKNSEVLKNLSDIAKYQQYSYLSECAENVNLSELCNTLYQNLQPDCNANGIILKNNVPDRFTVYAKPTGLESTLFNILFNALEHAECTEICISAIRNKGKCIISITDNGHGISTEKDIFSPYISEKNKDGGLGLYICREMIRSMNGELTYETSAEGTVFKITLSLS